MPADSQADHVHPDGSRVVPDAPAPLTPAEREEIRQRAGNATKGPWKVGYPSFSCQIEHVPGRRGGHQGEKTGCRYTYWGWIENENYLSVDRAYKAGDTAIQGNQIAGTWDYEEGGIWKPDDAEFIAHARTDIPRLLDALDAADAEIKKLRTHLNICESIASTEMPEKYERSLKMIKTECELALSPPQR